MENFDNTNMWRDVIGYEGLYKVSITGQIYSLPKTKNGNKGSRYQIKGKFLVPFLDGSGYSRVKLYKEKQKTTLSVHRILAEAFIPNLDGKPCVNHKNGVKEDNRLENLEWTTYSENTIHAFTTGLSTSKKVELQTSSKLKNEDVVEIRNLYSTGEYSQRLLAKKYNVDQKVINLVVNRKAWTHI